MPKMAGFEKCSHTLENHSCVTPSHWLSQDLQESAKQCHKTAYTDIKSPPGAEDRESEATFCCQSLGATWVH